MLINDDGCGMTDKYIREKKAADFLGYLPGTLRKSRCTGLLGGVSAPPYIKRGRCIFYSLEDLKDWQRQWVQDIGDAKVLSPRRDPNTVDFINGCTDLGL